MPKRVSLLLCILLFAGSCNLFAQSREAVKSSTDILMFLPSAAGAGVSLFEGDYKGLLQNVEAAGLSVATAYILKYTVKKHRPDDSDNHSFPSNHTGVAFAGATFLQQRYGWKWGAPAFAVAAYVGWGRIYAKRHDAWDVLAGAAIGTLSGVLLTTPYAKEHNLSIAPFATSAGGCGLYFSMNL